jgi:branched-chain amino acid transport system substrate-binding protein
MTVLDFKAITKVQSTVLIALIVVVAVGGSAAYLLWRASLPPPENIIIGVCGDLDMTGGKSLWRGAVLSAEQINAEGGVLGRNLTIVGEDDDSSSGADISVGVNALTKLITVDKADYIISTGGVNLLSYQDVCCEHKKILITVFGGGDNYTQRVSENYQKYKYSFRTFPPNDTAASAGLLRGILTVGNYTGFTKVALLFDDFPIGKAIASNLNKVLSAYGFKVVYNTPYTFGTTDFTSHFAAIEASGAEILVPYIVAQGDVAFVKEWFDRQSPFVVWGVLGLVAGPKGWEITEGKCDTVSFAASPAVAGYPLTNKTLHTREGYFQKWGEAAGGTAIPAYDIVRFILPDAIERAGTTETEAVIKALETTDIETSMARHFIFTSSHDVLVGSGAPGSQFEDYLVMGIFQWQNETQVPMSPKALLNEAGATYKYPPWNGPWGSNQLPP